jgi:hypothetical protein
MGFDALDSGSGVSVDDSISRGFSFTSTSEEAELVADA